MNTVTAAPAAQVRVHRDMAALQRELAGHAIWWARPRDDAGFAGRLTLHRCGELSAATLSSLSPADLPALQRICGHAFVNQPGAFDAAFDEGAPVLALAAAGIGIFLRHGSLAAAAALKLRRAAPIGALEFLLSSGARLDAYPNIGSGGARSEAGEGGELRRAVALLDLVQDFEILRPLLVRAAAPGSPFDLRVAITERFAKAPIADKVTQFLEAHEIAHFKAIGPTDVANALGRQRSVLLTASESTAAAHAFGHACCRVAPPRALRVTLQHGFECIGLRHHRAHDIDFPNGVRFASDVVLTWDHRDALPNLHPAEAHKCVTVGVIKAIAEQAALQAERLWQRGAAPAGAARRLLIAENLHSVRMRAPARHQRFLAFIHAARDHGEIELTIRSHPAGRTLEQRAGSNPMNFLDGMLRLEDLLPFDDFVSPPSTILLDAAIAGTPAAVWADNQAFGDAVHYHGLPVVTDFDDWLQLGRADLLARRLRALEWAIRSSAALNGAPMAWGTICSLVA